MPAEQPTTFQTLTRLTIMLGSLSCGSLAAWNYGPEPERLAEMIDSAAGMVMEVAPAEQQPEQEAPEFDSFVETAPPAELVLPTEPTSEVPRWDSAVQPASAIEPVARVAAAETPAPDELDTLERERLTAPALAAGALKADVQPWGSGDQRLYRATAAAPTGAAGLQRRLDAYGETPEAAVASLVDELQTVAR